MNSTKEESWQIYIRKDAQPYQLSGKCKLNHYEIPLYIFQYENKTWALTNEDRDTEQHKFSSMTVGVN